MAEENLSQELRLKNIDETRNHSSDSDGIRSYNHLLHKQTLNHLAKLASLGLNGWVFFWELIGCQLVPSCFHLNFGCGACFKQGVPWHSGKPVDCRLLWNSHVTW